MRTRRGITALALLRWVLLLPVGLVVFPPMMDGLVEGALWSVTSVQTRLLLGGVAMGAAPVIGGYWLAPKHKLSIAACFAFCYCALAGVVILAGPIFPHRLDSPTRGRPIAVVLGAVVALAVHALLRNRRAGDRRGAAGVRDADG